MSLRVSITRSAEKDLWRIWLYTLSRANPDVADRVIEEIRSELKKLAEMPGMGTDARTFEIRSIEFGRFILIWWSIG